jgi:hypothetical protein
MMIRVGSPPVWESMTRIVCTGYLRKAGIDRLEDAELAAWTEKPQSRLVIVRADRNIVEG